MKYYKMFNNDLKCRNFQYEVGKTYTHDGDISICNSGFHSCVNPFDCLDYYDLGNSRFAIVEIEGEVESKNDGDSKVVSSMIKIKTELSLSEFIKESVSYILGLTELKKGSGDYAKIGSYGDYAKIGSSGDYAQIGSSGDYAQIGSSGDYAKIGSSGNSAQIGSSGYSAQIGSSGYSAKIGSSGNSAQIGSSGNSAKIGSSGNSAKIDSEGQNSVISLCGINSRAKGKNGSWVSIAEYDNDYKCIGFATGKIGSHGLEEDTYYKAKNGELAKC